MMSKKNKTVNPGGVNGTGKGVVNTNSKDFIGLRKAVEKHASKQSPLERIKYELISLKFQMESYVSNDEPSQLIGVGTFLKDHLQAIQVKHKDFAHYIEMEESNLSSIIRGRRKVNLDLAYKLGQVFQIDPNLWLLVQSKNELLRIDQEQKLKYQKYRLEDLLKKVG